MSRTMVVSVLICAAAVLAGCGDTHESMMKKRIAKMEEMAKALKGVQDEASSRAAAPKIRALAQEINDLGKKTEALPEATEEEAKRLIETYMKPLLDATGQVFTEGLRIQLDPRLHEVKEALDQMNDIKGK